MEVTTSKRPAPTTEAGRLRVCREALERIARLDVGPEPFVRTYTVQGSVAREIAVVGVAQAALMDCWPEEDTYPEPQP